MLKEHSVNANCPFFSIRQIALSLLRHDILLVAKLHPGTSIPLVCNKENVCRQSAGCSFPTGKQQSANKENIWLCNKVIHIKLLRNSISLSYIRQGDTMSRDTIQFRIDGQILCQADQAVKEGRLLDIRNDVVFKSLLSKDTPESNGALRFLLGAVTGEKVTKATVLNPEITPDTLTGKTVRLDIRCTFNDGSLADIEMQKANTGSLYNLGDRMLYYNVRLMSSTLHEGDSYDRIASCYQISVLGYSEIDDAKVHHIFTLRDSDGRVLTDRFQIHYLELTKLEPLMKKPVSELSDAEICCIFIMYEGRPEYREKLEQLCRQKEEIRMARNALNSISKDKHEWVQQQIRERYETDYRTETRLNKEQAFARGVEQTARNMKADGMNTEKIMKYTGLTAEQIAAL